MEVVLRGRTLRRILIWVPALLILCSLLAEASVALEFDDRFGLVPFLSLSYEQNLPTWFSSCLLFSCAILLALIALSNGLKAEWTAHWWGLALAFLYISLDEAAAIHEHASDWFDLGGILYFGWVIPAGIIVALGALCYARFLGHLSPQVRARFILAGALYVGGALGVELPLAYWTEQHGDDNFVYALIDLVEESMEIAGAALFLYSLCQQLMGSGGSLRIQLLEKGPARSWRARHASNV